MLNERVKAQAGQSIEARFQLRDETLKKALEDIAVRVRRDGTGEERNRLGVQLRLICERDMFDRANLVWEAIYKAHQDLDGTRRPHIKSAMLREIDAHMRVAALALAAQLKEYSAEFKPAFRGNSAINAEWVARLRQRAADQQRQKVENYVAQLKRGLLR
ncbi:MAG: hypothetical protein R3200_04195 [Xanthomonadales bacterium]|nr:hypothetical protein [Xanthomonadales bacterium]